MIINLEVVNEWVQLLRVCLDSFKTYPISHFNNDLWIFIGEKVFQTFINIKKIIYIYMLNKIGGNLLYISDIIKVCSSISMLLFLKN